MELDHVLAQVGRYEGELVELLQDLVRIPSVNTGVMPTGNETPACELLARKLVADGIEAQVVESAPGRGNLVASLEGSRQAPRLLYMGHVDVVPVEDESEWTYPPFGGEVHDGRVHGRGSHDMKATVAAQVMAMLILKRAGVKLAGSLILAATADEEAGGAYGAGWLAKTHPELLRADFGITEGGGAPTKTPTGLAYILNIGEKGRYEVHITVEGQAWHASTPWRANNPLYTVATILKRLEAYRPEISTDLPLFAHLQGLFGLPEAVTSRNVDAICDGLAKTNAGQASMLRACSRMTIAPTMIKAGVKSNSIAQRCTLVCDIRSLPHQDTGYVQRQLTGLLDGIPGVSWELIRTAATNASPADHPFAGAVRRATAVAIGRDDFAWVPGLTTGFTDSRLVRPLGTIVYGFAPSHPDADTSLYGAHNRNESMDIASLVVQTRMLVALAWDVLGV